MPFSNIPWWLRLYQPQATQGFGSQDDSLPPPANMGPDPSELIAPTGGGNPIDPSGFTPYPTPPPRPSATPFPIATPISETFNPVEPDLLPGNEVPPPTPPPPPGSITDIPGGDIPLNDLPRTAGGSTPSTGGYGTRGDDSGRVPGVDLSFRDQVNMTFRSLGLPPLPASYNPFGGLPPGMTEGNRFGGGAPTFSYTNPLLNTGPQWNPGGSIFGGRSNWNPLPGGTYMLGGGPNSIETLGGKLAWHEAQPMFGGRTLAQVARQNPELLPGLSNMGAGFREGSPAGRAGAAGHGAQLSAFQSGGVVPQNVVGPPEEGEPGSALGGFVYGTGRKVEDKAHNVFTALGELGKYLTGGPASAAKPAAASMVPGGEGGRPSGLMKWLTDPDLSPRRMRDEMEPPPFGRPDGPPPYPWVRRFMPQLYDQRASGSMLAGLGGVYDPSFPPWAQKRGPWPLKREDPEDANYRPELFQNRASGSMLASKGAVSTDTVRAMLTPGEVVLNEQQQSAVMPVPGREHLLRRDQRAKLAKRMWS